MVPKIDKQSRPLPAHAKSVVQINLNIRPIVYYCKSFAESARFEWLFLKDAQVDSDSAYRNTLALGLLVVARKIVRSITQLHDSSEFEQLRKALKDLDAINVPKRLQDLAEFYGQIETDEITFTYARPEDCVLRLIDMTRMVIEDKKQLDLYYEAGILPFYDTSKFQGNYKKFLQAKLDKLTDETILSAEFEAKNHRIYYKKYRLPKTRVDWFDRHYFGNYSDLLNFPNQVLRMFANIGDIVKPFEFSDAYSEIGVWCVDTPFDEFQKYVEESFKQIKTAVIPHLESLYECSIYVPSKNGSRKQLLSKQDMLRHCLETKFAANCEMTEEFIGLIVSDDENKLADGAEDGLQCLTGMLRKLGLE